jgi:hypothetical protein
VSIGDLSGAEHVRVSVDQLGDDAVGDLREVEAAVLRRETGVKRDLQQKVAELLLELVSDRPAIDRVDDLVGFFDQMNAQ